MLRTPAPKRYSNISGLSPPLKMKRVSLGAKHSNVTFRTKQNAVLQGESNFAQSVLNQMEKLSTLEQKAPILENATVGDFMIFKPLFEAYKAQNGSKDLAQLLSVQAKNVLCITYNKDITDFNLVDDTTLMVLLERHFQVLDTNDYRSKLQALYMEPLKHVHIDKCQLYVQKFLNMLVNNQPYSDSSKGGGTPKQINLLFINGFQPPGFKSLVQDLGTENISDTVTKLNVLYTDIRTSIRITRRLGSQLTSTSPTKDTKNPTKEPGQQSPNSYKGCTTTHCTGHSPTGKPHLPENCFIMYPEKRKTWSPAPSTPGPGTKKGMVAVGNVPSLPDTQMDHLCAAFEQLKQDLEDAKKVILAKRQNLLLEPIPPDKPHYMDSKNNYSVIASLNHIDNDTSIILSHRAETLEIASGQQLAITGTGLLQGVDAIHVPESVASLTSASQFNNARNAVSFFFKMEV